MPIELFAELLHIITDKLRATPSRSCKVGVLRKRVGDAIVGSELDTVRGWVSALAQYPPSYAHISYECVLPTNRRFKQVRQG